MKINEDIVKNINWFGVWTVGGALTSAFFIEKYPFVAIPSLWMIMTVAWFWIKIEEIKYISYREKVSFELRLLEK